MIQIGEELPDIHLGSFENEEIHTYSLHKILNGKKNLIIGYPGVFTPICSGEHIPRLIENARTFFSQGFNKIICVSDDNPWAIAAWKKTIPNNEALTFLSDGNRDLLERIGISANESDLFMKGKYPRFLMMVEENIIQNLRVEDHVLDLTCTTDI